MSGSLKAFLAMLALVAAFVAAEACLHAAHFSAPLWRLPDPELGWRLRPGVRGWFNDQGHGYVRVNGAGFRDGEHARAKAPGEVRIAVLGDDFVAAMPLQYTDAFTWLLQDKLSGCAPRGASVTVMNFGVPGYSTSQESLLLQDTVMRFEPDLVLLVFGSGGDVAGNSPLLTRDALRPFYRLQGSGLRLDRSFLQSEAFADELAPWRNAERAASDRLLLVQAAELVRRRVQARLDGESAAGAEALAKERALLAPPRTQAWKDAWTVSERLLAGMSRFAQSRGVRFAALAATHGVEVDPDPAVRGAAQKALGVADLFYAERRLQALGGKEGFTVVPLAQAMQRAAQAGQAPLHGFRNGGLGVGPWNEAGSLAAAGLAADSLCPQLFGRPAPPPM